MGIEKVGSGMKAAGKRQKGSAFEREIAQMLREVGLDSTAQRMILSGGMGGFVSDIKTVLPLHIEAKRQEVTKFKEWYAQANGSKEKNKTPIVVWRENNGEPFVYLKFRDLLTILLLAKKGGWSL